MNYERIRRNLASRASREVHLTLPNIDIGIFYLGWPRKQKFVRRLLIVDHNTSSAHVTQARANLSNLPCRMHTHDMMATKTRMRENHEKKQAIISVLRLYRLPTSIDRHERTLKDSTGGFY